MAVEPAFLSLQRASGTAQVSGTMDPPKEGNKLCSKRSVENQISRIDSPSRTCNLAWFAVWQLKKLRRECPVPSVCLRRHIFYLTQIDIWDKFTQPFFPSPSHDHRVQGPRLEKNVALQQQTAPVLLPPGRHRKRRDSKSSRASESREIQSVQIQPVLCLDRTWDQLGAACDPIQHAIYTHATLCREGSS
jgi:hypothetical protein